MREQSVSDQAVKCNVDNIGDPPSSDPEARRYNARATGVLVTFIKYLDEWLATSRTTAKTQDMQRSDVKRFAHEFQTVQDIVGHERSTLTGSTYSGKCTFEMRCDALGKLAS
jgi:hypothetical protein